MWNFKIFFLRNMEDIGCCPSNVTIWSRYFRRYWKRQILSEINKVRNLASSHIWFLCEPNSTKKKENSIFYRYVFRLFLSPLWSDVFVFWKKWFLQKLQKKFAKFWFFFVKFVLKKWDKNFFFTFFSTWFYLKFNTV